jgi:hypothetical protein
MRGIPKRLLQAAHLIKHTQSVTNGYESWRDMSDCESFIRWPGLSIKDQGRCYTDDSC